MDVKTSEDVSIAPGHRELVPLGIKIACPQGTYARIAPRSGLAWKKQVDIGAGVIDRDYRGEVKALIINNVGFMLRFAVLSRRLYG